VGHAENVGGPGRRGRGCRAHDARHPARERVGRVECVGAGRTYGSLVVHTEKGALRGDRSGAVDSFLGVPYAAPPVGALRWQPPQPAQ
jgi:para-nitrobenzyl esterase